MECSGLAAFVGHLTEIRNTKAASIPPHSKMELTTLVIYDIEDDWARTRVSEACKDFGLERIQYSCFRGMLSRNKREELYERFCDIQRFWQLRSKDRFSRSRVQMNNSPDTPELLPVGWWQPAFKILIQPLCEKDIGAATYAYLFIDMGEPKANDREPPWTKSQNSARLEVRDEPADDDMGPPWLSPGES